ncbi:MAG: KamA family radical SAM protein, partial [Candidatus Rokuibacteriota bacterium]
METWQEVLRKNSIASLETLAQRFGPENFPELDRLRLAADNFEFRISPAMVDLIKSPNDPIWRQYVPSVEELEVRDGMVDSLNEDADSPVPNITHRYPDRALFLVSPVCATYCRFCTRRRKVGDPAKIPMSQFESAFQYLEAHTEIRDVIMSGGDPLMLSDRRIEDICRRLRAIPHLEVRRIGSRVPCHLPERVTPELCGILKKYHPLYINTHFNHPDELTPAAVAALGRLADAGIPLGCQTVLLKDVNDDPAVMKLLMQKLLVA